MIGWKTRDIARAYIDQLTEYTGFEQVIKSCLYGELKEFLTGLGIKHISYYLVWQPDYKFLDIGSRYGNYYYEWKFSPESFQYRIYAVAEGPAEPFVLAYEDYPDAESIFEKMRILLPKSPQG